MELEDLTQKIIGCAMKVHSVLGPGFLEAVYQKALAYELSKAGLRCEQRRPLAVMYESVCVGEFFADMIVEGSVLVETKAVLNIAAAHEAQIVNYLTATGTDLGLLLNFGADRLQFKRKHRVYRPKAVFRQDGRD